MSHRRRPQKPSRSVDIGERTLREYGEAERRQYHQKIREDVEKLLEEAAPRFRSKGWKVTETKETQ